MHPMAQLMRQCHHIARFPKVVEHHIRMHLGHCRMRECARCLARFHARVDPALVKERRGNVGHARIKFPIGGHDHFACLVPRDRAGFHGWKRRVAVPDLHAIQPQPLALKLIIPVRQLGIGGDNGVAQRLDHLGFDIVGQVARRLRGWHAAPAINDFFFLGLGVVHTGKGFDVFAKHGGQFARRCLALIARRFGQQVERAFDVQLFSVHDE